MSSRTSSRSTLTIVPSTISPSLKYLIVLSMAARKSSAEPMSLTATCGEVTVVGICWVAPDGLWSVVDIGTLGFAVKSQRWNYVDGHVQHIAATQHNAVLTAETHSTGCEITARGRLPKFVTPAPGTERYSTDSGYANAEDTRGKQRTRRELRQANTGPRPHHDHTSAPNTVPAQCGTRHGPEVFTPLARTPAGTSRRRPRGPAPGRAIRCEPCP